MSVTWDRIRVKKWTLLPPEAITVGVCGREHVAQTWVRRRVRRRGSFLHILSEHGIKRSVIGHWGICLSGNAGEPAPSGAYVFGDLCSGEIFMLKDGLMRVLLDTNFQISSFGEDEDGEIYVVNIGGSILHLTNPDKITASNRPFNLAAPVPLVTSTAGSAAALTTGYARVQTQNGDALPSGLAIFGFRSRGVLISEASVPLSPLISSGRIFAEVKGGINTGIAIANPNDSPVSINYYFTDSSGTNFGQGTFSIPANRQIAAFLNEAPFDGGNSILGSFTFSSSSLVSAIALRGFNNERSEFLMTTLPVVQPGAATTGPVTVPYFADGGGWTSQVVMTNPINDTLIGLVQFVGTEGQILRTQPFSIAPRSSARIQTDGTAELFKRVRYEFQFPRERRSRP